MKNVFSKRGGGQEGDEEGRDEPTELPVFNLHSTTAAPPVIQQPTPVAPPQTEASTSNTRTFLNVPLPSLPSRPKSPSVRLSYRTDPDSNSIYRSENNNAPTTPGVDTDDAAESGGPLASIGRAFGRRRAATVGARPSSQPEEPPIESDRRSWRGSWRGPRSGEGGDTGSILSGITNVRPGGLRARAMTALNFWDRGDGAEKEELEKEKEERERRERHDQQVIDLLDVIDPEVSTLTTLSDVQNSLFVPALGRFVNRSRFIRLTKPDATDRAETAAAEAALRREPSVKSQTKPKRSRTQESSPSDSTKHIVGQDDDDHVEARGQYYVLPEGLVDWEHWSEEDKDELDDYVRHLLHSRKWKAKRTWRGFKHYVGTPLGAFVFIYASLLTFWGAAWILFIIGWLHAGNRQDYFVEICDQVLTALFCVVGIGLAPFRTVDTYHMIYIAKYHRKTLRLLKEQGAAPLTDENDLPAPSALRTPGQVEEGDVRPPVLTPKEQATLIYHQTKFNKSHTFYRPHETFTHKAFPLDLLIVVVCLLDFHSIFQIALGTTTWIISYHHNYKKILTSVILSFSISCNITAGLVITVGNRRTRKEEVVREQLHKAVTEEAIKRREAKRERQIAQETHDAELHRLVAKPEKPYLG